MNFHIITTKPCVNAVFDISLMIFYARRRLRFLSGINIYLSIILLEIQPKYFYLVYLPHKKTPRTAGRFSI